MNLAHAMISEAPTSKKNMVVFRAVSEDAPLRGFQNYRKGIHAFTLLYVVEKIVQSMYPVFEHLLSLLSVCAFAWHFALSATDDSLTWPFWHYATHCAGLLLALRSFPLAVEARGERGARAPVLIGKCQDDRRGMQT